MADIEYRDIMWQVRAELPGVPMPLMLYHYAETVRDFCTRSKCWNFNIASPLDLGASTDFPTITQAVEIPANTYIVEPTRLKWDDGTFIEFRTRDQLDQIDADWEQATGTKPRYWTVTGPKAWRIYPLLSAATTAQLYMRVALAPSRTEAAMRTGMPEELAYEFQDTWGLGAMGRLMKIPGKDWSNPNQAAAYLSMYEDGLKMGKSRAAADFGRPDRFVEYGGLGIGGTSGRRMPDDYGR